MKGKVYYFGNIFITYSFNFTYNLEVKGRVMNHHFFSFVLGTTLFQKPKQKEAVRKRQQAIYMIRTQI